MSISIRTERSEDHDQVLMLIEESFRNVPESDQSEGALVTRLRQSDAFVPELSLVARFGDKIVGHILFTKINVRSKDQTLGEALALAPVSVHPDYQQQGIGGQLIEAGHKMARKLGFTGVVLLGHKSYYPRFGYEPASNFGIKAPWDVPNENYMAMPLIPGNFDHISGMVEYAKAFFE